jgi:hypothetical protein
LCLTGGAAASVLLTLGLILAAVGKDVPAASAATEVAVPVAVPAPPAEVLPLPVLAPVIAVAEIKIPVPRVTLLSDAYFEEEREDPQPYANREQIGTDVLFMKNPVQAFSRARAERKLVFMIHLSGNFEDKDCT